MTSLDTLSLTVLAVAFLAWGLWWFILKNDELPAAIAGFNLIFVHRLVAVEADLLEWVNHDYGIGFSFYGYPNTAATYMLLGGVLLVAAYCMTYRFPRRVRDDETTLKDFILSQRKVIIGIFAAFVVANVVIQLSYADAPEAILDQSYAYLFTLAHSAFIILITALLLHTERGSLLQKVMIVALVGAVAYFTLSPSLRFAVLGWSVALAIILTRRQRPRTRLFVLLGAGLVVSIVFSVLGALRQGGPDISTSWGDIAEIGIANLTSGSDVNMVDGFVMLMQVYPDVLDYGYGSEHLEILARPIPRALWPEKPPGGWTQKLALATNQPFFTTGISPSLYGSFYGEGGIVGIVVLSLLYGFLFAKYVNWANTYGSALRWVLRGVLIASLFPLMRGGDLPGIAAFIGMSYWPLALFLLKYRKALRAGEVRETNAAERERNTAGIAVSSLRP